MPLYMYQCRHCDARREVLQRRIDTPCEAVCEGCGSMDLDRVFAPFAVYRSELDKLHNLDPKYYERVDTAMANTREADPMRHLERMTRFDSVKDPGAPIKF